MASRSRFSSSSDDDSSPESPQANTTAPSTSQRRSPSGDDSPQDGEKRRPKRAAAPKAAVIESGRFPRCAIMSPRVSGSSDDDSDDDRDGRTKRKSTARPAAKRRRTVEDGELPSDDDDSPGDSETADSDVDKYDANMFLDDADKARLESMTEMEREQEIFKRIEQRELLKARRAIEQKLALKAKGSLVGATPSRKSRPRVASPPRAGLDDHFDSSFQRPSEVARKQTQKRAMLDLVNKRREKQEAEQRKRADRRSALDMDEVFGAGRSDDEAVKSSTCSSSSSSRSSSHSPSAPAARPHRPRREVATKEELGRARLSRFKLARFVHAPFFAKTVVGCFVRVGIGQTKGVAIYRIAQVVDVVETAKVYDVEKTRTNKGLKLRHGNDERVYRLAFISNADFTDAEFIAWRETMHKHNLPLITMDQVDRKEVDIRKALNYNYTEEDVNFMVKEKGRFLRGPVNYAMRKGDLIKAKEVAEQNGDDAEVARVQIQLEELEQQASELDQERSKHIAGISWINQRNRDFSSKMKDTASASRLEMQAEDDPFTRKNQRMKVVSGKDRNTFALADEMAKTSEMRKSAPINANAVAGPAMAKHEKEESPMKAVLASAATAIPAVAKQATDDLFSAHNFDLDIDIVVPGRPSTLTTPASLSDANRTTIAASSSQRSMTLDDYRRRKQGLL